MIRQGDVLLVPVSELPGKDDLVEVPPENGQLVLARGRATGHAHTVDATHTTLTRTADRLYLTVQEPCVVAHPEHVHLPLEPGVYEVVGQRVFNSQIRPVVD